MCRKCFAYRFGCTAPPGRIQHRRDSTIARDYENSRIRPPFFFIGVLCAVHLASGVRNMPFATCKQLINVAGVPFGAVVVVVQQIRTHKFSRYSVDSHAAQLPATVMTKIDGSTAASRRFASRCIQLAAFVVNVHQKHETQCIIIEKLTNAAHVICVCHSRSCHS